ncbi:MAG TPA: hypothetical protein VK012_00940 [Gemmatimonadales bacterium]|nr:hypothetical protein [Gemmatimonadales bacterium]
MPTPIESVSGVVNACQALPNVITGGQPTAQQIEALGQAGGGVVLDIRDPMEPRPFDEKATVEKLGMTYINVPISPGATGDAKLEQILSVLRENHDRTVFFHCGSGNRVGGAMIAHLMLDHDVPEEEAVTRAMQIGLRSPEYLEWGLEYAKRTKTAAD